ncbi:MULTISPECIES: ADP-ribosylglycohydrolase family protein [unclassified Arthrobacter]|uniref:ADP-ribosylglycohydrolase family protein n=1 Tax=unclassified Arthrobacter TaxID=235627 RepID=UPI002E00D48E|nr:MULTISPECIES: ADP-ribosylglycohydrolase family protein [unclassified Arthrobacter]MEC5191689.1 ADP-ribosylglycohydrolase [Arthrobacter sp. MP_M4]MEC5203379.1 ADP-ribosylglycohydrolase [Arthrobacter sp. MP_M7]
MSTEPARPAAPAPSPSHASRILGCLLGGALGDSLGYAVESKDIATIRGAFGKDGLRDFAALDGGSSISDDTQLTLYTVDGLLEALEWANSGVAADTNACLWLAYLRWFATQGAPVPEAAPFQPPRWIDSHSVLKHRRAPEQACLSGLATGAMGTYFRPVNPESNGHGTVMRSAPFGLIPYIAAADVYKLSADAASLTHGHPAARQGAGVFSLVIHALVAGQGLRPAAEYALGQLNAGMLRKDETVAPLLLARLDTALRLSAEGTLLEPEDLVRELGEGQSAEEALAVALYAVLATEPDRSAHPGPEQHFRAAIAVAVNHSGNSGSTASMAGNILGTFYGEDCLPAGWLERLEAPEVIRGMASRLAAVTGA